ncbi:MAG: hypothetical protein MUF00_07500 [Gemmatimonadaceae bacterium]|jgi:hypothetical protein|nr:hypothetical protein [Gemmatimonadaceae bacterium]
MTDEHDYHSPRLDARDAAGALDVARQARARIAARAATPWWYPPAYGVGVGGLVAGLALPDRWVPISAAACMLLLLGAYALWRRQSGLHVFGWRAGRTRTIAVGIGVATALAGALAIALRDRYPDGRGPLVCGVLLGLIAARASAAWDRAWRAELLEEPE